MLKKIDLSLSKLDLDKDLLESGLYCYQTSIDFLNNEIDLQNILR